MKMWLAYARAGKEIEVIDALASEGITAHCAMKVEAKRVGKRRKPDVFITPLLTNYLFVECEDHQYLTVTGTKHIASTMAAIPKADQRSVMRFIALARDEFDSRMAKLEAGERLDQFSVGDVLSIIEGPLSGLTATFKGILDRDRDLFPSIKASVDMMGQAVSVELDPISVRAAS